VSPDGKTVALVTDAPDPDNSNVVLQFFDLARDRLTRAGVPEVGVLGHQDPEWRPDGKQLLYTMNDRDGAKGAAGDHALRPQDEGRSSPHDPRLHAAVVFARRTVHRGDANQPARDRCRDPQRE
jgi:hypothetical protein